MSDVGLSLAQMRAASATNLLLLGFDTHMFDAKARPEEVLRAPIDHKRFETLLHFLLTVVFPNDVELKACWPIASDKARQSQFQRSSFALVDSIKSIAPQLRTRTVLQATVTGDRHYQLLFFLSTIALRARLERDPFLDRTGDLAAFSAERALEMAKSSQSDPQSILKLLAESIQSRIVDVKDASMAEAQQLDQMQSIWQSQADRLTERYRQLYARRQNAAEALKQAQTAAAASVASLQAVSSSLAERQHRRRERVLRAMPGDIYSGSLPQVADDLSDESEREDDMPSWPDVMQHDPQLSLFARPAQRVRTARALLHRFVDLGQRHRDIVMRAVDETLQPRLTAEQLKHAFEVSESNEALWTSLSTVDGQVDLKAMQSHFNSALQTLHQKFRALQQLDHAASLPVAALQLSRDVDAHSTSSSALRSLAAELARTNATIDADTRSTVRAIQTRVHHLPLLSVGVSAAADDGESEAIDIKLARTPRVRRRPVFDDEPDEPHSIGQRPLTPSARLMRSMHGASGASTPSALMAAASHAQRAADTIDPLLARLVDSEAPAISAAVTLSRDSSEVLISPAIGQPAPIVVTAIKAAPKSALKKKDAQTVLRPVVGKRIDFSSPDIDDAPPTPARTVPFTPLQATPLLASAHKALPARTQVTSNRSASYAPLSTGADVVSLELQTVLGQLAAEGRIDANTRAEVAQQLRSSDAGSRQAAIAQLYAAASVTAAGASAAMPASTPQPAVSRSVFGRVAPRSVLPSSTVKAAPVPAVAAAPAAAAAATSVKPVKSVASKSVKKPIATASVNKPPKAAAKAAAPTGSSRAYSDLVDTVVDAMLDGMEGSDLPDVMLPTVIPSQSASAAHLQAFEDPMLALNSGNAFGRKRELPRTPIADSRIAVHESESPLDAPFSDELECEALAPALSSPLNAHGPTVAWSSHAPAAAKPAVDVHAEHDEADAQSTPMAFSRARELARTPHAADSTSSTTHVTAASAIPKHVTPPRTYSRISASPIFSDSDNEVDISVMSDTVLAAIDH